MSSSKKSEYKATVGAAAILEKLRSIAHDPYGGLIKANEKIKESESELAAAKAKLGYCEERLSIWQKDRREHLQRAAGMIVDLQRLGCPEEYIKANAFDNWTAHDITLWLEDTFVIGRVE